MITPFAISPIRGNAPSSWATAQRLVMRKTALVDGGSGNQVGGRPSHPANNAFSASFAYRGLRPARASAKVAHSVTGGEGR